MSSPVITLDNSSGFKDAQMKNLNSMIISQKNRWLRKRNQTEIDQSGITAGISELSGVLSISTPYCNNHLLYAHGYIRLGSVTPDWMNLFKCESNIKGFYITGNASEAIESNKDISMYVTFRAEEDYLQVSKLQESSETFEVNIVVVME
jgi:hypothetical protein